MERAAVEILLHIESSDFERVNPQILRKSGFVTRNAIREASRHGAPPTALIVGNTLCEKLKEFEIGVETTLIEEMTVILEWFDKIRGRLRFFSIPDGRMYLRDCRSSRTPRAV